MIKPTKITAFYQHVEIKSTWKDCTLESREKAQIKELVKWLKQDNTNERNQNKSHLALICGSSSQSKTLVANLLGRYSKRDVYRIDLPQIISKFIGETEKNLDAIFEKAKNKNWILFFDEADALFGKRTSVSDSHDKYANQEVSYLLQHIEHHDGLVILSVVSCKKLDKSFINKMETIIAV